MNEKDTLKLQTLKLGRYYPELESRTLQYGRAVMPDRLHELRQFNRCLFKCYNNYCSAAPYLVMACMAFDQISAGNILESEGLLRQGIDERIFFPVSIAYDVPLGIDRSIPLQESIPIKADLVISKQFPLGSTGNGLAIVRDGHPGTYVVYTKPGTTEQYIDHLLNSSPIEFFRIEKYFNQTVGIIGGLEPLDRLKLIAQGALNDGVWGHEVLLKMLKGYGIDDVADYLAFTTSHSFPC